MAFTRTDNTFAYTLWYNASQTFNETQDVSEIYGIPLLSFVRGLDEAIASYAANASIDMDVQLKDWPIIPVPGARPPHGAVRCVRAVAADRCRNCRTPLPGGAACPRQARARR